MSVETVTDALQAIAQPFNGPIVVLDFKRKRVEMLSVGTEEGKQTLEDALNVQQRLHPATAGIAPPPKEASSD